MNIEDIRDHVDIDAGKAWLEFTLAGEHIHWDAEVDNDWLDPYVVVKYDDLLSKHTDLRIYSNHIDFGQSALFACFTQDEFERFARLSTIALLPIADQV